MAQNKLEQHAKRIFDLVDVKINGNSPWNIKVNNPNIYSRAFTQGTLVLANFGVVG